MNNKEQFKRKNIFIKRRFQTDFALKFLLLIVIESLLAAGLFIYFSRGTVITGYTGAELVVARTGEYFLPNLLLINLFVIGITAIGGFFVLIFLSHRIAGPLYRFEKSLEEVARGNLTHRFSLRGGDELDSLAEKMNGFNSTIEDAVAAVQRELTALKEAVSELGPVSEAGAPDPARLKDITGRVRQSLNDLDKAASYFTTHYNRKG